MKINQIWIRFAWINFINFLRREGGTVLFYTVFWRLISNFFRNIFLNIRNSRSFKQWNTLQVFQKITRIFQEVKSFILLNHPDLTRDNFYHNNISQEKNVRMIFFSEIKSNLYTYKTLITLIVCLFVCLRPCIRILDTEWLL